VYQVFERLNTSGANLTPHEIRVALYSGEFVRLLRDLNGNEHWRELYGPPSNRLKDQELILRFAAFRLDSENYKRPLKRFLNDFVKAHRSCQGVDVTALSQMFADVCSVIAKYVGRRAFRATGQVNAALVDAVMFGLAKRLDQGPITSPEDISGAFEQLVKEADFLTAIGRATADEDRVARRLSMGTAAFSAVR